MDTDDLFDGADSSALASSSPADQNNSSTVMPHRDSSAVDSGTGELNPYAGASLLCGIFMIGVSVIGLVANATTVRIFTHRPLVSSINTLLAGLAVIDAALLVSGVPLYSSVAILSYVTVDTPSTRNLERAVAVMTVYLYGFTSICQTSSVWTMVLITVERYIAVSHPFMARTMCTWRRAVCALVVVFVASVLYNVCRFWEYELKPSNETSDFEVIQALKSNKEYMTIYGHWMYFGFLFALPFAVLLLLNTLVVITIRQANHFRASLSRRQCKEHATATMMVLVASGFLACNCLGCLLNAMDVFGLSTADLTFSSSIPSAVVQEERSHHDEERYHEQYSINNETIWTEDEDMEEMPLHTPLFYFLIDLSNLLVMIHCSCNFFIYITFSKRFRNYFCLLSPCCHWRQRRLGDVKRPSVFDRDPLSGLSMRQNKRKSTTTPVLISTTGMTAAGGDELCDVQLVPATPGSPIGVIAVSTTKHRRTSEWIPMKPRRQWSFASNPPNAAHSSEILICRQYHVVDDSRD